MIMSFEETKSTKISIMCMLCLVLFVSNCATFRTDIIGKNTADPQKNIGAEPVSIFFIFSFMKQTHGWDAIPKVKTQYNMMPAFNDLFSFAKADLSNISNFSTFYNNPKLVSQPEERCRKDSLQNQHDYTIKINFFQEQSFAKHFLGGLISTTSLTMVPVIYKHQYSIDVAVYDDNRKFVKNYKRSTKLNTWMQTGLIFLYPFHPKERKKEEMFIAFLQDIFKEIESDKILVKQ